MITIFIPASHCTPCENLPEYRIDEVVAESSDITGNSQHLMLSVVVSLSVTKGLFVVSADVFLELYYQRIMLSMYYIMMLLSYQSVLGVDKMRLPTAYTACNYPTDELDTLVRLCLIDPNFSTFVSQVDKILNNITGPSATDN